MDISAMRSSACDGTTQRRPEGTLDTRHLCRGAPPAFPLAL